MSKKREYSILLMEMLSVKVENCFDSLCIMINKFVCLYYVMSRWVYLIGCVVI